MKHRIAIIDEVKARTRKLKTPDPHKTRDTRYAIQNVGEKTNIRDMKVPAIENKSASTSKKCTGTITLSSTGPATSPAVFYYLGRYEATGEEHEAAPVYIRKSDGKYLYRHSDGTWSADDSIGYTGGRVIQSVDTTAECPARVSQWRYEDYSVWRSGDITAQCNVHTQ